LPSIPSGKGVGMLTVRVEADLKKADYYVYVYIDPRDLKPFYYGMGKGSRKDAHLFDRTPSKQQEDGSD
jgi:hypothetical protein